MIGTAHENIRPFILLTLVPYKVVFINTLVGGWVIENFHCQTFLIPPSQAAKTFLNPRSTSVKTFLTPPLLDV